MDADAVIDPTVGTPGGQLAGAGPVHESAIMGPSGVMGVMSFQEAENPLTKEIKILQKENENLWRTLIAKDTLIAKLESCEACDISKVQASPLFSFIVYILLRL